MSDRSWCAIGIVSMVSKQEFKQLNESPVLHKRVNWSIQFPGHSVLLSFILEIFWYTTHSGKWTFHPFLRYAAKSKLVSADPRDSVVKRWGMFPLLFAISVCCVILSKYLDLSEILHLSVMGENINSVRVVGPEEIGRKHWAQCPANYQHPVVSRFN